MLVASRGRGSLRVSVTAAYKQRPNGEAPSSPVREALDGGDRAAEKTDPVSHRKAKLTIAPAESPSRRQSPLASALTLSRDYALRHL